MNICILSGGRGNDAILKGLYWLYPKAKIDVIIGGYDDAKSTEVCRKVTDTLGVSDVRKNHERMYKLMHSDNINEDKMHFMSARINLDRKNLFDQVMDFMKSDCHIESMPDGRSYLKSFREGLDSFCTMLDLDEHEYNFNDFSVSNIIYAGLYTVYGYEFTNKLMADFFDIPDFVSFASYTNAYIQGITNKNRMMTSEYEITDIYKVVRDSDEVLKDITFDYEEVDFRSSKENMKTVTDGYQSPIKHGALELESKAKNVIKNADMIIISTGTFWSSIFPTLIFTNISKYLKKSNAKKFWVLNNELDIDMVGSTSNNQIEAMFNNPLTAKFIKDFKIVVNNFACAEMQTIDNKYSKYVISSDLGNDHGKHDAYSIAKFLFRNYYGLNNRFSHFIFDFDDTLYGRTKNKSNEEVEEIVKTSRKNLQLLESISKPAFIVSGNTYSSLYNKIKYVPKIFNKIPIWADTNSIEHYQNQVTDKINDFLFNSSIIDKIKVKIAELGEEFSGTDIISNEYQCKSSYIKISTFTRRELVLLQAYLNQWFASEFYNKIHAYILGKTTLDILVTENDKKTVLDRIISKYHIKEDDKICYIGDEIEGGNDENIAKSCHHAIKVNSIDETQVILELLNYEENSAITVGR